MLGDNVEPKYGYYLLNAYDTQKVFYHLGGGVRQQMDFSDLKHLIFLLPDLAIQRTIVAFLNKRIGQINSLIEKKQKLIELLKEKRQALITHAVTKGLDPKAKMKDSGVEWLGKIPERWQIKPFRAILEERKETNVGNIERHILSVMKDVGVIRYADKGNVKRL